METQGIYTVDSVPVASLTDRYGVGRTALYDRLKALGIEPEKRGRASYVSADQLDQLDQLDTRLKAGEPMPKLTTGHLAEHDHRTFTEQPPNTSPNTSIALSPSTDSGLMVLASMLQASLREPRDLMQNYRDLQAAADHGWLLPTDKIRELIGVSPRGDVYDRLGFRFVRSDRRTEWSVSIAPRATHPE
jgi:hypothetical protein